MGLILKLVTKMGWPSWIASLIGYLIVIAVFFGAIWSIYDYGKRTERAVWVEVRNAENIISQVEIRRLKVQSTAIEQRGLLLANISKSQHEKDVADAKKITDKLIRDIDSGHKRLFINTKTVKAPEGANSETAKSGQENIAETRSELSDESARFFVRKFSEADKIVIESNFVKERLEACEAQYDAVAAMLLDVDGFTGLLE